MLRYDEMRCLALTRRRFARLAALTALVCAGWIPVHGKTIGRSVELSGRSTSDASVWAAALPNVLTAMTVPPGWQLVSMIADDIDADGDLDVVANDGSLDLIVWINDGTGRLSRQGNRAPSGRPDSMSGPGLSEQSPGSQAAARVPTSTPQADSAIAFCLIDQSQARPAEPNDPSPSAFVSTRSPRGPPTS
jgi:hypothetical protein